MSWLDDLYRIVGKGDVRDSDFILNGESFYCPQCGRHLKAATGTVKGSEEKRYRFKCVDRMHYRTKWHESYQAALMNEIQLTDHLTARISAEGTCGRYRARIYEDGDFRESLYAMSLKRLKRKCEKYANRERKAIAYVATLKEES